MAGGSSNLGSRRYRQVWVCEVCVAGAAGQRRCGRCNTQMAGGGQGQSCA